MKNIFKLFLLSHFLIINADFSDLETINNENQEYVCVSLGFNCTVAINLRNNKLRELSFPFDWNITSLYGLRELINNNFIDLLNPNYLEKKNLIFNTKYKIAFGHDFPEADTGNGMRIVENYLDYVDEIHTKYQRRINRFYDVCNLAKTVYFFRLKSEYWIFDNTPEDKENIIKLRDALMKSFPQSNWILVAIDTSAEYQNDWAIPNVKNFYISDHGKNNEWTAIFKQLGLLT
ncbi:MAG: DUF1796 family putative cysteine peptidase [Candidatus Babeliales bacterium]|nr:DUF1796 family putative cysteine peptidase [Candidatus Babeliales bacterium]